MACLQANQLIERARGTEPESLAKCWDSCARADRGRDQQWLCAHFYGQGWLVGWLVMIVVVDG